jgi:hypothetical protein
MGSWGIHVALGACVAVLALGGGVCFALAPETKGQDLANVTGHDP